MRLPQWPIASLGFTVAECLLTTGCCSRFDPAHFEGSRAARRAEPEALLEVATRSSELEALGTVHASCTLATGYRRLDGELLSDLDCSGARLEFALRESAASAGGEVLVGMHCNSRLLGASSHETYHVSCGAEVARFGGGSLASRRPLVAPRSLPAGRPAPSATDVARIDDPDASLGFRIAVSFEPSAAKFGRRPRAGAQVNEFALLPLADRPLGDLVASCEGGCDELELRRSVLIAAGRLGAPDVIAVRCFSSGSRSACLGTLAAPEHEE